MSRKIHIKSETLVEVDIARKVVDEMRAKGYSKLQYDEQQNRFINEQWDDVSDNAIQEAVRYYGIKLQERRADQTEKKLKEKGYIISRKILEDGKIKIIAKQRVYA